MAPTSPVAPLTHSEPHISSIKPRTSAEPKVPAPAPPGPAETPPTVYTVEGRKEGNTKAFSTKAPPPGLPSSPARSQLSIDSDSEMTEVSGLLQEVSIPPPQKPRPLIIFIIGGPGSGKGSQAARLARCLSLRVISLDELLRQQLLNHASPSRKWGIISEMMGHGDLGPQEETISELRQQLIGQPEVSGFIVDGFPRDVHQALSFQEQIGSPDLVVLLLCSNETLRCRLQRRATHLGLLGNNSHALQRRLETFQRDIVSISRYYRQLHLETQVDADRDEETVFADLSSVVREKLRLKDSGID
ncbi:adenylate kinase isoenzyme 5-like [Chelmon rostratus]|uniref:adenylate kinase isoenzyme 5-like n=1 Tax=Chelmon rostratus TaxID=109905 RepID=UPI001BECE455|nr:adenylate kinase isoenzyme 5-like [Chelmon rostratus]